MIDLHGGFFYRPVQALHLPIGPGLGHFGASVLDAGLSTTPRKQVGRFAGAVGQGGELHPVVSKHRVDAIWHRLEDALPEGHGRGHRGLVH